MRLIQLSDIHLCASPAALVRGNSPQQRCEAAFRALAEEAMDFLLLCGDISDDGSLESYQRVAAAADALSVPWGWIPGNHDDPAVMASVRPLLEEHWLVPPANAGATSGWRILGLNTWVAGSDEGELSRTDLEWLADRLESADALTLLALHHPPIAAPARWMGECELRDQQGFWRVVDGAAHRPRAILSGHIHLPVSRWHNDMRVLTSPGCIDQFKADSDDFATDPTQAPGYLVIELSASAVAAWRIKRFDVDRQ